MILYLVRHGETAYNRDGLGLGRSDVPLTPLGRTQAAALGQRLADQPITRILSSPLARALDTAAAIAGERGVTIEPRAELLELDVGLTEGMTFPAMRERFPDFLRAWGSPAGVSARMPGGESIEDVANRLAPFAAELRELDAPGVAVVSHNFVARVLLCQLLGLEIAAYRAFVIGLASYCALDVSKTRTTVLVMNEGCHLNELESPASPA